MSTFLPRPYRGLSVLQVFDIPREPEREHLCTYVYENGIVTVSGFARPVPLVALKIFRGDALVVGSVTG